jgi:hypothetical protein
MCHSHHPCGDVGNPFGWLDAKETVLARQLRGEERAGRTSIQVGVQATALVVGQFPVEFRRDELEDVVATALSRHA